MQDLAAKSCKPCEGGTEPLSAEAVKDHLGAIDGRWSAAKDNTTISAKFKFKNYYQTTAFINAVAWIAHTQDHHPDIGFGYNSCEITYSTHAIGGLSENDFICAAKIDRLLPKEA